MLGFVHGEKGATVATWPPTGVEDSTPCAAANEAGNYEIGWPGDDTENHAARGDAGCFIVKYSEWPPGEGGHMAEAVPSAAHRRLHR